MCKMTKLKVLQRLEVAAIKNKGILKCLLMMVVSLFLILNFSIGVSASSGYDRQEADACITISERLSVKGGRKTGTYKELREAGYKDAHHIIQDAAVKDIEGYNKGSAPAIQLEGPSNQVGTEHYIATTVQRQGGGGTYGQERGIAYKALRKAGFSIDESKVYVRYADNYFMGELGLTLDSPTRIPGNRKGH
ncbi:MAG: hypothetical protein K6B68_03715 [Eubacterium sp.]|nr:hypothetical protein [Eubacterium sp.]